MISHNLWRATPLNVRYFFQRSSVFQPKFFRCGSDVGSSSVCVCEKGEYDRMDYDLERNRLFRSVMRFIFILSIAYVFMANERYQIERKHTLEVNISTTGAYNLTDWGFLVDRFFPLSLSSALVLQPLILNLVDVILVALGISCEMVCSFSFTEIENANRKKECTREAMRVTRRAPHCMHTALTSAGSYETEYVITVYCTTDTRNYCELLVKVTLGVNKGSQNEAKTDGWKLKGAGNVDVLRNFPFNLMDECVDRPSNWNLLLYIFSIHNFGNFDS